MLIKIFNINKDFLGEMEKNLDRFIHYQCDLRKNFDEAIRVRDEFVVVLIYNLAEKLRSKG